MPNKSFFTHIRERLDAWRSELSLAAFIAIGELGSRVGLPGVDKNILRDFLRGQDNGNGLLGLYNFFAAGGIGRGALLAIGVLPYASARIFVWLGRSLSASFRARTNDERTHTRLARGLAVGLAAVQSFGYAQFLQTIPGAVARPGLGFTIHTVALLTGASIVATLLLEPFLKRDTDDVVVAESSDVDVGPTANELPIEPAGELLLLTAGAEAEAKLVKTRDAEKVRV